MDETVLTFVGKFTFATNSLISLRHLYCTLLKKTQTRSFTSQWFIVSSIADKYLLSFYKRIRERSQESIIFDLNNYGILQGSNSLRVISLLIFFL